MIGKLAEFVGVPMIVVAIVATLLYFDFGGSLTQESHAADGKGQQALLDTLAPDIPSLPVIKIEFPNLYKDLQSQIEKEIQSGADERVLAKRLHDLLYRALQVYRPLLKYADDDKIITVLKAKRALTLKLKKSKGELVCAQVFSGSTGAFLDSYTVVESESTQEGLALFQLLADAQVKAKDDGLVIHYTAEPAQKKVRVIGKPADKPTDADLYLPANPAFDALMKVYPMDSLSRIFAADPTDTKLCDSEVRLYDALVGLPAPHGPAMRKYIVDLLYFAGY
ncbi:MULTISPECIES: hypothetical protein [unclassified Pseudovibrio]|uniref:hypothetical protein n=1 Tax=unclassified Pseudovibrio TaxID=2627060 RepID=UPI0007AEB663|nr:MULTISPECIES: hypothetical protein [unclassified Pseudovibrio]KZK95000.1 hypothetical protein PsW74_04261 [Pseudovibrio sp. W74]KZL08803.1 hypothetical protein PsAD14_02747 [Pseudovibrio sp. Ad14]